VVVLSRKLVEEFAAKSGIEEHEYKDLLEKKEIKQAVLKSILDVSRKEKLKTFETVQNVHLTQDEWTPENDMLTAAMKLKRRNIYEK
jgi:long-chain acyl-CoA synthetase